MTEAEILTKYWTDTVNERHLSVCLKRCVKRHKAKLFNGEPKAIVYTFADGSAVYVMDDGSWIVE